MSRPTLTDLLAQASPAVRKLNPELFNGNTPATPPLPGLGLPHADLSPSPHAKLERRPRPRALAKSKAQKGDSRRFFVRVISYRVRLLDEDNLCEKYGVDCLRYSGILPGDSAAEARIVTSQEKVSSKDEERTTYEISLMP